MPKFHVTLRSGRDFIMESDANDEYELAYEAYEEAAFMDDYLVDIRRIGKYLDMKYLLLLIVLLENITWTQVRYLNMYINQQLEDKLELERL